MLILRPFYLTIFLGLALALIMFMARHKKYCRLERGIRICLSLICFIGGLFFVGMAGVYVTSDFRSALSTASNSTGLGLGFMIGSGMFLFLGLPLMATSILLFKYKNGKG